MLGLTLVLCVIIVFKNIYDNFILYKEKKQIVIGSNLHEIVYNATHNDKRFYRQYISAKLLQVT